jgi:hypothetical protein
MNVRWEALRQADAFLGFDEDDKSRGFVAAVVKTDPGERYPWAWYASMDRFTSADWNFADNAEHAFLQAENSVNGYGGTW